MVTCLRWVNASLEFNDVFFNQQVVALWQFTSVMNRNKVRTLSTSFNSSAQPDVSRKDLVPSTCIGNVMCVGWRIKGTMPTVTLSPGCIKILILLSKGYAWHRRRISDRNTSSELLISIPISSPHTLTACSTEKRSPVILRTYRWVAPIQGPQFALQTALNCERCAFRWGHVSREVTTNAM